MNETFHFRDHRPPPEIQHRLESRLSSLFRPIAGEHPPVFSTAFRSGLTSYQLRLRLNSIADGDHSYTLQMESSGPGAESLSGWAKFWTGGLQEAPPREPAPSSSDALRAAAASWLAADSHLDSVASVQAAILEAMRAGAVYSSAHKEGGTTIRWRRGTRFVAESYGESSYTQTFSTAEDFFAYLWESYDWRTSQYVWPERIPEIDAWKLILRFLEPERPRRSALDWIRDTLLGR